MNGSKYTVEHKCGLPDIATSAKRLAPLRQFFAEAELEFYADGAIGQFNIKVMAKKPSVVRTSHDIASSSTDLGQTIISYLKDKFLVKEFYSQPELRPDTKSYEGVVSSLRLATLAMTVDVAKELAFKLPIRPSERNHATLKFNGISGGALEKNPVALPYGETKVYQP